jgi:hypothetical protein
MKKLYFLILPVILATVTASVTKTVAQQPDDYYSIRDAWTVYFNAHPDIKADTDEAGEYQHFMRWQMFWQNRVDHSNPALTGKLYNLKNAFSSYNQSIANLPPNVNPNPWSYCGPVNQVKQHNALISAIWVDTISDKHQKIIYAGTDASGIWKTTDGGLSWSNVTDASGFYLIGVNNIKGDPTNPNVIYAATGGGGICSGTPFGVGIICSTDAGATWNVIYSEQLAVSNYILVDNGNSNRLYIGSGNRVIRLAKNGSLYYDTVIYQDTCSHTRYIRDIEMKPGDPEILYIATDDNYYGNRRASVVKLTGVSAGNTPSVDYFHPFCDSLRSERYEIAINPITPNSLYVIGQIFQGTDSFVEIWKSVNSGSLWSKVFSETYVSFEDDSSHVASGGVGYQKLELLTQVSQFTNAIVDAGFMPLY